MLRIVRLGLILGLCWTGGTSVCAASYAWPLKKFAGLTSLFGDYRSGRYHAGIDLRTGGQDGWPVVAVGDGYVMRASTSYYGYGRGLYLQLDDGRIAVYGHLQAFGPEVTRRVRAEQRLRQRYATNQHFEPGAIRVRKGMTIARSGQTGAGAPHLHFELRSGDNQPLNPFTHGFKVRDTRDPEITRLWLVPGYAGGQPAFGPQGAYPAEIALAGSRRAPLRLSRGPIRTSGPVGFVVEAYDLRPGTRGRHNVNGLLLVVAGDTVFQARFDTLDFATMTEIDLERPRWLNGAGDAYALYKSTGNAMMHSRYHPAYPRGFVDVQPGDSLPFTLVVTDSRENRRTILGSLVYTPPDPSAPHKDAPPEELLWIRAEYIEFSRTQADPFPAARRHAVRTASETTPIDRIYARDVARLAPVRLGPFAEWGTTDMAYLGSDALLARVTPDDSLSLVSPDSSLHVFVPRGAVYDTSFLYIQADTGSRWRLGPHDLVLRKPVQIRITQPGDSARSLWTENGEAGKLGFVERRRTEGAIHCTARGAAVYVMAPDTTAPTIRRLWPGEGAKVRPDMEVRAVLEDDLAGVGNDSLITVRINGEWIVPEFDPETKRLVARPWAPLKPGDHTLEIEVWDWAGNRAARTRHFRVSQP